MDASWPDQRSVVTWLWQRPPVQEKERSNLQGLALSSPYPRMNRYLGHFLTHPHYDDPSTGHSAMVESDHVMYISPTAPPMFLLATLRALEPTQEQAWLFVLRSLRFPSAGNNSSAFVFCEMDIFF